MKAPRNAFASPTLASALALALAVTAAVAHSQQPARNAEAARGLDLYRQGRLDDAARALRAAVEADKNDAESWHLLGVVLNSMGRAKEARKAFETAVRRRPGHADAHAGLAYTLLVANKLKDAERAALRAIDHAPRGAAARYMLGVVRLRQGRPREAIAEADRALADSPDHAPSHLLRGQAHLDLYGAESAASLGQLVRQQSPPAPPDPANVARRRRLLEEAALSYERYLQLVPDSQDARALREQVESLRVHASASSGDAEPLAYGAREVTTRAVILSRPEPLYTERAREEGVEGTVILRLVLAADGTVKHIFVVRGLSHGLTEKSVEAARRIQFRPATKDGRPVSQVVTIVFNFNIG